MAGLPGNWAEGQRTREKGKTAETRSEALHEQSTLRCLEDSLNYQI